MAPVIELRTFYQHINKEQDQAQPDVGHFNLFKVEELLLPNGRPVSYSRRDFFKISFVKGQGKVHYADRSVDACGTVLVFTNPMIPFFWERISPEQSGFVCIFTEAFFNRYGVIRDYPVFQQAANGILPLKDEQAKQFEELFERMYKELKSDYAFKYDLLRNLLMEVIHGAQKLQPAPGSLLKGRKAAERIAALFAELLERQFPIELNSQVIQLRSAADFARQLNVHVNHLNKALKGMTGHTTMQLINERIMQEARVLLKGTTWTIGEIARCFGFEEPNHFSVFFKSRSDITPNHYRQSKTD
jgi:AraC family transcriptional activator of pobA